MKVGSMDSCCWHQIWPSHLYASEIEIHQNRLCFSSPAMWSSAVVAHPSQGSTCCAFWDAFLLTTIVHSGYLDYCSLSVSSKQSGHSLLTSLINKIFPSAELLLTVCFFVHHSENPWRSAVTEILKPACLAPTIMPLTLYPHSVENNWSSWSVSAWFYVLHCCHTFGWFDYRICTVTFGVCDQVNTDLCWPLRHPVVKLLHEWISELNVFM